MKDYLGQDLKVGDKVVYLYHGCSSSDLREARVDGFTNCFVKLLSDGTYRTKAIPTKVIRVPEALQ